MTTEIKTNLIDPLRLTKTFGGNKINNLSEVNISLPHYIILTQGHVTIPGDVRSQLNPGHGYPEHTQEFLNYEEYQHMEHLKDRVEILLQSKTEFKIFTVTPMTVETRLDIKIK